MHNEESLADFNAMRWRSQPVLSAQTELLAESSIRQRLPASINPVFGGKRL